MESVADLAGMTGDSGEHGDLAIGCYPARRDLPHDLVDSLVRHRSGAALHSGGKESNAGYDGDTSDPGGNCALLFH